MRARIDNYFFNPIKMRSDVSKLRRHCLIEEIVKTSGGEKKMFLMFIMITGIVDKVVVLFSYATRKR